MDWSVSGGPLGRAGSGGCSSAVRESRLDREECSDGEEYDSHLENLSLKRQKCEMEPFKSKPIWAGNL
jgi:hypothetical protein